MYENLRSCALSLDPPRLLNFNLILSFTVYKLLDNTSNKRFFMKTLLLTLGCLIPLSSSVYGATQCPDTSLIEENIDTFSHADEGEITLHETKWKFNSTLVTSEIESIKNLNEKKEISDKDKNTLDENTCNYLIYPMDSNMEDASLILTVMSK